LKKKEKKNKKIKNLESGGMSSRRRATTEGSLTMGKILSTFKIALKLGPTFHN
jgi:hypothetical protein